MFEVCVSVGVCVCVYVCSVVWLLASGQVKLVSDRLMAGRVCVCVCDWGLLTTQDSYNIDVDYTVNER